MGELGTDDASAWKEFWARNAKAGAGGCLPARWSAIENAQQAAWQKFFDAVPGTPRVLDIATGDGRVLAWLLAMRPGIDATGTDLAPQLPPPPRGAKVHAGIAMENLPFADASFDVITSQFGFEYGDSKRTTAEISRLLAPGGTIGLIVHRGDGPILEHNASRRAQIQWVLNEIDLITSIHAMLNTGNGMASAVALATETAKAGARQWGEGSAAWEIPEAVRRTLLFSGRGSRAQLDTTLAQISFQASNELGRIESLGRACFAADDREELLAGFEPARLQLKSTVVLREPGGRAFADFLTVSET